MLELIKKYWDIISGIAAGLGLAIIAEFELESVQLYYSIIILILVSIGVLRIIKQEIEKQRIKKAENRKHNLIDSMIDGQKPVKAISLATDPLNEGTKIGNLIINLLEVTKNGMKKLKELFDKFKGYLLTIAFAVLTVIEMCGGFINAWLGDALVVNGIAILPFITLACTVVVGLISNGYTKEQRDKIKALFAKSTTNELVKTEIKKNIKEIETKLKDQNKALTTKEAELKNLESELESARNTYYAKVEMRNMTPQLATEEDVQTAANAIVNTEAKIVNKKAEIEETTKAINNLTTTLNALKGQL